MRAYLKSTLAAFAIAALGIAGSCGQSATSSASSVKPTIVLVHGAFAESASWEGVIPLLIRDGYRVVAAANPLRSVAGDASEVASLVSTIHGSVVLVGHSYGGAVITQAAHDLTNVKALVYVSAFEPDIGETSAALTAHDPGSTLGPALAAPVALPDGSHDLYVDVTKFHAQFCADAPEAQAALLAVMQRPIRDAALNEPVTAASWKTIPSYAIYGAADLNIPPATMAFMSARARSRHTIVVAGASHVVMVTHPDQVAALIEEAATH